MAEPGFVVHNMNEYRKLVSLHVYLWPGMHVTSVNTCITSGVSQIFCITAPQPSSLTFKTQWIRQRLESSTPERSCFFCLFLLQVSLNALWTKHNFKVKSRLSGGEKEDSLNNEGPAVGVTWSAVFELWCQIARSEVVPSPEKTRDERLFSRKGNITLITLDLVNSVHSSSNYANCVVFFCLA